MLIVGLELTAWLRRKVPQIGRWLPTSPAPVPTLQVGEAMGSKGRAGLTQDLPWLPVLQPPPPALRDFCHPVLLVPPSKVFSLQHATCDSVTAWEASTATPAHLGR